MNESLAGGSERDECVPSDRRREWSADEIRRIGYRAVDMIAEYLMTLPEKACVSPAPTGSGGVVFSMRLPSEALHSLLVP